MSRRNGRIIAFQALYSWDVSKSSLDDLLTFSWLQKDSEIQANEILADVSAASTIGRDYHLTLDCGSQIDADVMQPMMEKILSGEDVKASVTEASAKLDEVLGL